MGVKRLPSIDKPANFADLYACSADTYYSTLPPPPTSCPTPTTSPNGRKESQTIS